MFAIELYFLFYRLPKMMTQLARQRGRSALRWSLLGIGTWLGAEFAVILGGGIVYGIGQELAGWPEPMNPGYKVLVYVFALVAALLSTTLVSRILTKEPIPETLPPPPPEFPAAGSMTVE